MKTVWIRINLILGLILCQSCKQIEQAAESSTETKQHALIFGWPFMNPEEMLSRGGSSQGSSVTLAKGSDKRWLYLQQDGLSKFQRDRRAILAMAGNYRTSFQFTETAGFIDDYTPPRPYFSWGTEHVSVIEDSGEFISLQHTLVMYFEDESGEVMGPMVMKHWRQDWSYQDTDLHTYRGNRVWERRRLSNEEVQGSWSQAVFQVDDSPRYEVIGRWNHGDQFSAWASETSLRPLPRREYSVRNDYNILEGEHRVTLVPNGWVHEQHNRKSLKSDGSTTYVAQELGVNRYERITSPDLSAADETWIKTSPYWKAVRDTWKTVFEEHDRFQLKSDYEDTKLYEFHFSHAAEIEQLDSYDAEKWSKEAQGTIAQFLNYTFENPAKTDY